MKTKVANDLLELASSIIDGKFLFLSEIKENSFKLAKILDKGMDINVKEGDTMDLSDSYCQRIVTMREPWIINEAQSHPFTCKLELTQRHGIQSYVGVLVFYQDGELYGTICAIDSEKSKFTEKEVEILSKFANLYTSVIELERRAKYDQLTSLFNRGFLYDNFNKLFNRGTLLLLDLDGFKEVNDQYGHEVGDLVLRDIGTRIRNFVGLDGEAFRLGGDEFVAVFPDMTDESSIEEKATRLLKVLAGWDIFNYDIKISASIGIVLFTKNVSDVSKLLKKADIAMYQAKQKGKNTFHIYRVLSNT